MKQILVRGRSGSHEFTLVDDADFDWLSARSWRLRGGYAVTRVYAGKRDGKSRQRQVSMHRVILGLTAEDARQVDHINRQRLDNRRSNLRVVTQAENKQNLGKSHRPSRDELPRCEFRGVHWSRADGRWRAGARVAGKFIHLGFFDDPHEANRAVSDWRAEHMPLSDDANRGRAV